MGRSLDAHLGYGIVLQDEGGSAPWVDPETGEELMDPDEWVAHLLSVKSDEDNPYTWASQVLKTHDLETHLMGVDGAMGWVLVITSSYVNAYYGATVAKPDRLAEDMWNQVLMRVADRGELTGEVGWLLWPSYL